MNIQIINYGPVKTFVKPLFIFWIIFSLDLELKFCRQTMGIPMGTNCASLVADLFLFCYERDFMKSLSRKIRLTLLRLSIPLLDTSMIN